MPGLTWHLSPFHRDLKANAFEVIIATFPPHNLINYCTPCPKTYRFIVYIRLGLNYERKRK